MLKTKLGRLRKANRELEDSICLSINDDELLNQMFTYLSHKRLNPYDFETVRADVLGMAQEASKRKQPLRELIGDDRAFCAGLLANCNKKTFNAFICEWISLAFFITFFCCSFFFISSLYSSNFSITTTADRLFPYTFLWLVYYMLWTQIIPLPYAIFKNKGLLMLFVLLSWLVLRSALFQGTFLSNIEITISGFANLAALALSVLGWLGLQYAADTLAYKQSSFGGKRERQ